VASDSSDIDAAVIGILQNDAALKALMPDGVYMDEAPPNSKRFVIVSLVLSEDRSAFPGKRVIESIVYLVKAVMLNSTNGNVKGAAARIDELLESKPLTVNGYGWMTCNREERVRYTEVDDVDATIRWQHRGGRYRVEMALA
jgi:hypothetical protein